MSSLTLENLIDKYSETHLICDAHYPLITNSTLEEESLLYNLNKTNIDILINKFHILTGKELSPSHDINNLSGGQKVILMVLFSLYSKAKNIVFLNLDVSLDIHKFAAIEQLIAEHKSSKQEILLRSDL